MSTARSVTTTGGSPSAFHGRTGAGSRGLRRQNDMVVTVAELRVYRPNRTGTDTA